MVKRRLLELSKLNDAKFNEHIKILSFSEFKNQKGQIFNSSQLG